MNIFRSTARACPVATFDAAIDRHVRDHRLPRPDGQAECEQRLEDAVSCLGKQNGRRDPHRRRGRGGLRTRVSPGPHIRSFSTRGERSATTESGAASGQRMPFPDYVSAQGPVPTPWTQVDPVVFSRLRRAAPGELQRPCGCAWSGPTPRRGGETGRMVENVSRRARSVDVFQQGRFLFPCQPLTSPLPKSQFHRTKGRLSFKDRSQRSSLV